LRTYEIMLILPAEADDKVIGTVTDRIAQVLSRSGGQIAKADRWGRRRLAYPIDKLTEGYYLLVECAADPADIKELDRVLSLADEVIRFKTVVLPEKRVKAPAVATPAAPEAVSAGPAPDQAEPEAAAPAAPQPAPAEAESAESAETAEAV